MTAPPENAPEVRLSTIGQIAVRVRDLPRAVAFYRDALGLPLLFQAPPALAFFQCGDVRVMLSTPEKPEFDHPASVIYFRVADIQAAHGALAGRGVPFVDQPHVVHRAPGYELWMAFFRDPDHSLLALMAEQKAG